MSLVKATDLAAQGIDHQNLSELIYQGRLLVRQNTFSRVACQEAVALCEKHLMAGRFCILVIDSETLALWLDAKHLDHKVRSIPQLRTPKSPLLFRGRPLE